MRRHEMTCNENHPCSAVTDPSLHQPHQGPTPFSRFTNGLQTRADSRIVSSFTSQSGVRGRPSSSFGSDSPGEGPLNRCSSALTCHGVDKGPLFRRALTWGPLWRTGTCWGLQGWRGLLERGLLSALLTQFLLRDLMPSGS